jgi:N-acetylneuraminate lyase
MPGSLRGLIPACHTPFHRSGHLDLSVVPRQAELYREAGTTGVFVAGTTGEWSSLTREERMALCDRWTEVAGDDLAIAVHVGHNCQADAIALASHARESGAAAIAAVAPSYVKPATVEDLVTFLEPIAAAAAPLPFYYYEIPGMTNVRLSASEFLQKAGGRMPNLRGLKFSHNDMVELQECIAAEDSGFRTFFGMDEFLLAGMALGVEHAVGCTYNFAAGLYRRFMQEFAEGKVMLAEQRQLQSARIVRELNRFGFLAASKAVMALLGVDCGPVRPPLRSLSPEQVAELFAGLRPWHNVFDRPLKAPA